MKSFDEWYFDAKQHNTDGFTNREFYEAGAASRQAEIDSLKQSHRGASIGHDVFIKQLKERHKAEIDELHIKMKVSDSTRKQLIDMKNLEIDELQKMIDKVTRKLESIKADSLRPSHHDYDKGWRDCAITVLNDLKGKQND